MIEGDWGVVWGLLSNGDDISEERPGGDAASGQLNFDDHLAHTVEWERNGRLGGRWCVNN
jgi:hypothetical protein